ncbi:MAG: hypothetical protein V4533_16790 [Pseudomonadota bacterium]
MEPKDRELVTRSIANLWTFNALFIGHLLRSLRESGMQPATIEALLQTLDAESDEVLEGPDDQLYAAGLLAVVRNALAEP